MAGQDELDTSAVALVGFVGAIVLFAVIVVLVVVFYQVEAREQYAKDTSQAYGQVSRLAADQQGRLAGYGWVDEEDGVARIPIDRAMDLVVSELKRDPNADVTGAAAATGPAAGSDTEQAPKPDSEAAGKPKEATDAP
jgi:hypothetical protein